LQILDKSIANFKKKPNTVELNADRLSKLKYYGVNQLFFKKYQLLKLKATVTDIELINNQSSSWKQLTYSYTYEQKQLMIIIINKSRQLIIRDINHTTVDSLNVVKVTEISRYCEIQSEKYSRWILNTFLF